MPFRDGLGERRHYDDPAGDAVEVLLLRRELSTAPSFELALRERIARLATFQHPSFARVRTFERSNGPEQALSLTSDRTAGLRLSELLVTCADHQLPVPLDVALCLIRQLIPPIVVLHERAREVAHGALGPERLIIAPNGRLVITEYVLGSALEQLLFSRDRYWSELRIALPRVAGLPRFDHLADITQLGVVALSLILGRPLEDDEYPGRIGDVVSSAMAMSAHREAEPLPAPLRAWLHRALQLDTRHSFPSAADARTDFERVLAEIGCEPTAETVNVFLTRFHASERESGVQLPADLPIPIHISAPAPPTGISATPEPLHVETLAMPTRPTSGLSAIAMVAASVVVIVLLMGGGLLAARRFLADPAPPADTRGKLLLTTIPAGLEVFVDGTRRGTAPLTLRLAAGSHKLELRGAGEARILPIRIAAGAELAQYVELQRPAPPAAQVPIAPTSSEGLVKIVAPVAAPPSSPAERAAPAPGRIVVSGSLDVQVFEGSQLLGSNRDHIIVPAGPHDLELVNEELGYRETRTVRVASGETATLTLDRPKGTVALNAQPWAEVWIDGERVGETPIGDFSLSVGSHDVVFRHPELGERRDRVLVTLKGPARVSADMRAP